MKNFPPFFCLDWGIALIFELSDFISIYFAPLASYNFTLLILSLSLNHLNFNRLNLHCLLNSLKVLKMVNYLYFRVELYSS